MNVSDFNPRSPHGERHNRVHHIQWRHNFNPRSPHGERRFRALQELAACDFNPRSPHGERQRYAPICSSSNRFQSTLPARGATPVHSLQEKRQMISIHAPRTGSDADVVARRKQRQKFQSTLPARGATAATARNVDNGVISIHAPRTGSDGQSADGQGNIRHFNPRSPHGERRKTRREAQVLSVFQSTLPARGATKCLCCIRRLP